MVANPMKFYTFEYRDSEIDIKVVIFLRVSFHFFLCPNMKDVLYHKGCQYLLYYASGDY